MRGSASTPGARGTSRSRSTCACTCGGGSRSCRAAVARVAGALARQARSAGDALMPSFTHFRPAQPVLVAHFLLAHAAPLQRDHQRLASARARSGCPAPRLRSDRRHQLRRRCRGHRARSRLLARRAEQHRCLLGSRFRGDVSVRLRDDDGASQPTRRGLHHLLRRRAPVLRALRRAQHRQQHDAAEEEPRPARTRARQDRPGDRPPGGAADHDQGAAERLQQGSAGRQAGGVRRRRHADRLPDGGRIGGERLDAQPRRGPKPPLRGCCSPPTSRTTSWAAACPSGARTKLSGPSCGSWWRSSGSSGRSRPRRSGAPPATASARTSSGRVTPQMSVGAKRTPQSTAPAAVGAQLAELERWLERC